MSNYRSNDMYRQLYAQNAYMQQPVSTPCYDRGDPLENMTIAMAYVPWQQWRQIYEPAKGFHRGTIFKELDKPFVGKRGGR